MGAEGTTQSNSGAERAASRRGACFACRESTLGSGPRSLPWRTQRATGSTRRERVRITPVDEARAGVVQLEPARAVHVGALDAGTHREQTREGCRMRMAEGVAAPARDHRHARRDALEATEPLDDRDP